MKTLEPNIVKQKVLCAVLLIETPDSANKCCYLCRLTNSR